MPLIPFPNVPKLPGVPQLNRSPQFPAGPPPSLNGVIALGRLALALLSKPQWGVYLPASATPPGTLDADGTPTVTVTSKPDTLVLHPDSIRRFNFNNEWDVSDFPIEQGSFASYNKVNNPFEIQLRMTKGGSLNDRKEFLQQLEDVAGSLRLYKILTPEKVYLNCNVTRYTINREEASGAYFFAEVDVFFREIRTVTQQYTTTAVTNLNGAKDPGAQAPVNNGSVAAAEAPTAVAAVAAEAQ